jgi:hypothetical protein
MGRVAEVGLLGAKASATGGAQVARAADRGQERHAGAIARSPVSHLRADGFHPADPFVAQGDRRERQLFQAGDEEVRVTDAARFHPQ